MKRRSVLATLGAVLLAGCDGPSDGPTETRSPEPTDPAPDDPTTTEPGATEPTETVDPAELVEIVDHELRREDEGHLSESVAVVGEVENGSDSQLNTVTIRVWFLDGDGDDLDTGVDIVSDLDPGETVEFEVRYPGLGEDAEAVDDYEIEIEDVT